MTPLGVNQFYDGSTLLEPLSKATDLPIDQVTGTELTESLLKKREGWSLGPSHHSFEGRPDIDVFL